MIITAGVSIYILMLMNVYLRWPFILYLLFLNLFLPFLIAIIALLPTKVVEIYASYLLRKAGQKIRSSNAKVIGITGSFGKTATKIVLSHVLKQKYSVFMPPSSYNTILSISQSVLDSYSNQEIAVIEYAAYRTGEIAKLAAEIKPEIAVITGLTAQHLGLFGSVENIIAAKSELIKALPAQATIYYANESAYRIVAPNDLSTKKVIPTKEVTEITGNQSKNGWLEITVGSEKLQTKLVGEQYIETIKTVWAVARDLGMSTAQFIQAMQTFVPPKNFTSLSLLKTGTRLIDDGGTSNPVGFTAALQILKKVDAHKKILITSGIVDLGEKSAHIHTELAMQAHQIADEVWYVGSTGKEFFREVFGEQLIDSQSSILRKLQSTSADQLLLIEGRMPGWFTKVLNTMLK
jgi:UDP-N-acetylmuramoyl-tripeptide--D-alanyl-D-alanine ligase